MDQLVDDLYGKIKHILLSCKYKRDVLFVDGVANAFDKDVTISVAYPEIQKDSGNPPLPLQKIAQKHKNVIPFDIEGEHTTWIQDTIHAFDGKKLVPWLQDRFCEVYDEDVLDPVELEPGRTKNILESAHWDDLGFKVTPNKSSTYIQGGQIMRCGSDIYLDNDVLLKFPKNIQKSSIYRNQLDLDTEMLQLIKDMINEKEIKDLFFKKISYLTGGATPKMIGLPGRESHMHMDFYYHPNGQGAFISEDEIIPGYENREYHNGLLVVQEWLAQFNKNMNHKNNTAIPFIFPKECEPRGTKLGPKNELGLEDNICVYRKHKIPEYAPINAQYEIFEQDGNIMKRIYMPTYPYLERFLEKYNFKNIQEKAKSTFKSQGFEVREIPFYSLDAGGQFRCASKVLERGKYNFAR